MVNLSVGSVPGVLAVAGGTAYAAAPERGNVMDMPGWEFAALDEQGLHAKQGESRAAEGYGKDYGDYDECGSVHTVF